MKLHELKASAGARKAVTRKGRGAGSGNGKTAGYGHISNTILYILYKFLCFHSSRHFMNHLSIFIQD